jgi:hypothetical protein
MKSSIESRLNFCDDNWQNRPSHAVKIRTGHDLAYYQFIFERFCDIHGIDRTADNCSADVMRDYGPEEGDEYWFWIDDEEDDRN